MSKEEIIRTRSIGLGSSDAAMVAKIGRNGSLNPSDIRRIAIMLGLEEQRQFTSAATDRGNKEEALMFEEIKKNYPNAVSNPYNESEILSEKYGFKIFNHIDAEIENKKELIWIEAKATMHDFEATESQYADQIDWHWVILKEKAERIGKKPRMILYHINTVTNEQEMREISSGYIDFETGLQIIKDALPNFTYEPLEELEAEHLPENVQNKMIEIRDYLVRIKELENEVNEFKQRMLNLMESEGVKSIKSDYFNLTLVEATTGKIFDSARFKKENPEFYNEYQKEINRKSYLKITTK